MPFCPVCKRATGSKRGRTKRRKDVCKSETNARKRVKMERHTQETIKGLVLVRNPLKSERNLRCESHNRGGTLVKMLRKLSDELETLQFPEDIWVYNPLKYASLSAEMYMQRYGEDVNDAGRILFVGMNAGPWGMVQTGVPFGDVTFVRDWMGIESAVEQPSRVHPKRRVDGFQVHRGEKSGERLWGLMKDTCGSASEFFKRAFVYNYCPLAFFRGPKGKNVTPDRIPHRKRLLEICDEAFGTLVSQISPAFIIGIGNFAFSRIQAATNPSTPKSKSKLSIKPKLGLVLHPSPASPKANKGWARQAIAQMQDIGCWAVLSSPPELEQG
eukprot:jgi/Bigna1/134918/aug1.27_g9626